MQQDYVKGLVSRAKFVSEQKKLEQKRYDRVRVEMTKIGYGCFDEVMDIFDAVSAGRARTVGYDGQQFAGHGMTYYQKPGNDCEESVANWAAIKMQSPAMEKLVRKHLPDVAVALDNVLAGMEKKAKGA